MPCYEYGAMEVDHLKMRDRQLGAAIDRIGMIEMAVNPDLFSALVNSIVAQQISAKAAHTVWNRLEGELGQVTAGAVCAARPEQIQKCGLSMRKASYIKGVGEAVQQGRLDIEALVRLTDEEVVAALSALPGVGVWTAEMMLIFSLRRPNVVSWGDLAIRRGMMNLYGLETLQRMDFEHYRERYAPFGTVASLYLWRLSHEQ
ncbi:MAG: DNA-3-methyladenine glycosylase [Methanomassiliicoccales archaeon]